MAEILHRIWALLVYLKVKDIAPIAISLVALFVSLRDRRPRLALRARKGEWCVLSRSTNNKDVIIQGVVEAYNVSARANAIRGYEFWCRRQDEGTWRRMESETYNLTSKGEPEGECNVTPLIIAPYSGTGVHIMALIAMPQPKELDVRVEAEDLFGKRYRAEIKAKS